MMGAWAERSWDVINAVHDILPADISLAKRTKAIDAAYPFGLRKNHPYKVWLRCRKKYLDPYRTPEMTPLMEIMESVTGDHGRHD